LRIVGERRGQARGRVVRVAADLLIP
jgi:hypothetical protein